MGIFDQLVGNLQRQSTTLLVNAGISAFSSDLRALFGATPGADNLPSNFDINAFRTNISAHNELAKSDKFAVMMNLPRAALGLAQPQDITLLCEGAELPGRDINLIEFRHYGFTKRIPHMNQYGQATFTFIMTGDMELKKLFDYWMDFMVPTSTGLVSYPLDGSGNYQYETDITVVQYDMQGTPVYSVKFLEAMPTSISQISQSWSDDSVERLTVTFAFKKWQSGSTRANIPPQSFSSLAQTGPSQPISADTISQPPVSTITNTPPAAQPAAQPAATTGPLPGIPPGGSVDYGNLDLSNPFGFG